MNISSNKVNSVSIAFQTNKNLMQYEELGKLVEDLGFDMLSIYNDLFYQPPWIPLSILIQSTKNIQVGVASMNPFINHPLNIAGNIALLNELSDHRVYLGLCRGSWLETLNLSPKRPISALKEAFLLINYALSGSLSGFQGQFFQISRGNSFRWKIQGPKIPFLLGSWGEKTINHCKEYISELKLGGTANPRILPKYRKILDSNEKKIALGSVTVCDEDSDKARATARYEVALYLPIIGKLDKTLNINADLISEIRTAYNLKDNDMLETLIDDSLLEKVAFVGTDEEIFKQTMNLFHAGADRVEFGTPHGVENSEIGINLLGQRVLPQIREKLKEV